MKKFKSKLVIITLTLLLLISNSSVNNVIYGNAPQAEDSKEVVKKTAPVKQEEVPPVTKEEPKDDDTSLADAVKPEEKDSSASENTNETTEPSQKEPVDKNDNLTTTPPSDKEVKETPEEKEKKKLQEASEAANKKVSEGKTEITSNEILNEKTKIVSPIKNLNTINPVSNGFISIKMLDDAVFIPKSGVQVVQVSFRPNKASTGSRKLVISGFSSSGLKVIAQPAIGGAIESTSVSADFDALTINFISSFNESSNISFLFSMEFYEPHPYQPVPEGYIASEQRYNDNLTKEINGNTYLTGLKILEYVDSSTTDQSITSYLKTDYKYREGDYSSGDRDLNEPDTDGANKEMTGLALYTSSRNVEDYNTNKWVANKEAEYVLAGVSRTNFSNDIDGKPVSDRFIKNMRIEIPLPPNVTFVSSEYSVGDGKNGIKINMKENDSSYIVLECKNYIPPTYNKNNPYLKFTMTLDYSKVPYSPINEDPNFNYSLSQLHNFSHNGSWNRKGVESLIPGRFQENKPWKFSGEMFGTQVTKIFDIRSRLILSSIITKEGSSTIGVDLNDDYSPDNLIKCTKSESVYFGSDGKISNNENATNPIMSLSTGFSADSFKILGKPIFNENLSKKSMFEIEQPIQITGIKIGRSPISRIDETIIINVVTSKGRVLTINEKITDGTLVQLPTCNNDEYIKSIAIETVNNSIFSYLLVGNILDKDIDGNKISPNKIFKISMQNTIDEYKGRSIDEKLYKGNYRGVKKTNSHYQLIEPEAAPPKMEIRIEQLVNKEYKDITFMKLENTKNNITSSSQDVKDLSNIEFKASKFDFAYNQTANEPFALYQMITNNNTTLRLTGYNDTNKPDITINYTTSLKKDCELVLHKEDFKLVNGNLNKKIVFELESNEIVTGINYKISSLPKESTIELSLDSTYFGNDVLPSGTKLDDLPSRFSSYLGQWIHWEHDYNADKITYTDTSLSTIKKTMYYLTFDLKMNPALTFSTINYDNDYYGIERKAIYQGESAELKFELSDIAFNPTYAFEIDKNFNYIVGSFESLSEGNKFVEEWLPNYFTKSNTDDASHLGNGLLRIRFIGSGSDAFNLFPINHINPYSSSQFENFRFGVRAKFNADVSQSIKMLTSIYRSDDWARNNLVNTKMDAVGYGQEWDNPISSNPIKAKILDNSENDDLEYRVADKYDIDDDGNISELIYFNDLNSSSNRSDVNRYQQVTKQTSTNVSTYLTNLKTGEEIKNSELYPHDEVGFTQSMLLNASADGKNFIGYYHIPKKGHEIKYSDENGKEGIHKSLFNMYLTEFISTTVKGEPILPDKGLIVSYFISEDPTSTIDGHNDMNELNDPPTQDSENYKTEAEINALASSLGKSVKEILANCTMVKFKATTIEANSLIVSKTKLAVGHKDKDITDEKVFDFFSGVYKYVDDAGNQLPKTYTPLTTFRMMPYIISGNVFTDKNTNSIMDPFDSNISGVEVELWETGNDPHTGAPITDKNIYTSKTDDKGFYSFNVDYHGDYYLKIKEPTDKKICIQNQSGAYEEQKSVFKSGSGGYAVSEIITLTNDSKVHQNAGFIDKRSLNTKDTFYVSVGETIKIPYQITPSYLMDEEKFKLTPTLTSDTSNNEFFTSNTTDLKITGVKEGTGKISLEIPNDPVNGSTPENLKKEITIIIEPESVASVSVPTKANVYAIQGNDKNVIIAPTLTVYNYGINPVNAYLKHVDLRNTGIQKSLKLIKGKVDNATYSDNEISLNVKSTDNNNAFSQMKKTDLYNVEDTREGVALGVLGAFETGTYGQFTFDGIYSPHIRETQLLDNKYVMSYYFTKVTP